MKKKGAEKTVKQKKQEKMSVKSMWKKGTGKQACGKKNRHVEKREGEKSYNWAVCI